MILAVVFPGKLLVKQDTNLFPRGLTSAEETALLIGANKEKQPEVILACHLVTVFGRDAVHIIPNGA